MPIRFYLSILVSVCLVGGYLVEYFSDGRHNSYQALADVQNNRLLIEKDYDYFQKNVSQLIISTDLILGSSETYLINGAIDQIRSLLSQAKAITDDSMLVAKGETAKRLIQSLLEIESQLQQAATVTGDDRNAILNKLLAEYDETSKLLVSSIGLIDSAIANTVEQGRFDLVAAKEELKKTRLLSILVFSAIILVLWVWSDRKISRPLVSLAEIAEEAESSLRFDEVKQAPTEVLQLSSRLSAVTYSLIQQARLDPLTSLLNRREFERRLTALLNENDSNIEESPGVICYIDLDHFKIVNDTCGHGAGDEILIRVANVLSDTLRTADIISRLGGDEFGMVFVGCPLNKAIEIAQVLRELIAKIDYKWNGEVFRISASIGLSEIPAGHTDLKAIVNTVDAACSAAKSGGRNRVQVLDSADATVAENRNEMILLNQIYNAIEQSNFILYSQPIVRLDGLHTPGQHVEILIRMLDNSGKAILPAQFLPTVERYQLSISVDKWVLGETIAYLNRNVDHLDDINVVNVNLSGHSLGNVEFREFASELLRENPRPAEKLCFEITETTVSTSIDNSQVFVRTMRDFGVRFALDDFGSGHSSFNYLKTIAFDYIKIDGEFIQGMLQSSIDLETVISVIKLAEMTNATVIAEYVDKPEIEDKLKELGVGYGQGFLYSEPTPLEDLKIQNEMLAAAAC